MFAHQNKWTLKDAREPTAVQVWEAKTNSAIPELFKLNYPHPVHKTKFHTSSMTEEQCQTVIRANQSLFSNSIQKSINCTLNSTVVLN